jgi:hypothetical protein
MAKELPGFVHEGMFKSAGVGIQDGGFEAELTSGSSPAGNRHEDPAENVLRFFGVEAKTRCGSQSAGNARFFLIFRNWG